MEHTKQFLNINEASQLTGLTVQTIYRKIHEKAIPAYKIGNKAIRFDREELISWIKSNKIGPKVESEKG